MNIYEAIRTRRSVRAFKDKEIPEEVLGRILEAGRLAPSGHNRQKWKLIVVKDKKTREALARAARNQKFVGEAPVVIVAVGLTPDNVMSCGIPGDPVDVAIAIDHMTLAAVEEGLGTCWIGAFYQDEACKVLGVPSTAKIIEMLPLGYPDDAPKPKKRKPLAEIISQEKF